MDNEGDAASASGCSGEAIVELATDTKLVRRFPRFDCISKIALPQSEE